MKNNKIRIEKTVLATIVIVVFFFAQGAAVIMGNLEGIFAVMTQGTIIWGCALLAIIVFLIKDHNLKKLGFVRPVSGSSRRLLYYIPLILIAVSSFAGGIKENQSLLIYANLFLTLGIGFAEEIYFRGIICDIWKDKNLKTAVEISSLLFAVTHIMNMLGGEDLTSALLQICFAFVYGIVMALIFIDTGSIRHCILLHAFHDFCGFITCEGTANLKIVAGSIQFIVLLIYSIYLWKKVNIQQTRKLT